MYDQLRNLLPLILMVGVFYVVVLRPTSKEEKSRKKRLEALKKGDRVVLEGGILGRISSLDETVAVVEVADKVKLRVLRKDLRDLEADARKAAGGDRAAQSGKDAKPAK